MLERLSFALANAHSRMRFTHFIYEDGTIASLYPMESLHEMRVGVINDFDFPTEEQYASIRLLAQYAVGLNPTATMTFEESTAPFDPLLFKAPAPTVHDPQET